MNLSRVNGLLGSLGLSMHLGCASPMNRSDFAPAPEENGESPSPAMSTAQPADFFPWQGWIALSEARTVEGISFSAGSTLSFEDGRNDFFILGADQFLQGVMLPEGTSGLRGFGGARSGSVSSVRLPVDWFLHGYPFAKGVVQFLGTSKIGILGRDCSIQGNHWKKGDMILVDEDGNDLAIRPFEPRVVGGIGCAAGHWARFYENGKLENATLSRDHVIRGVRYAKGTNLFFDWYGQVMREPGLLDVDDRLAAVAPKRRRAPAP